MWSEFSYVKQVFFLKNTFWCFFFIFSYSGYYLVFNLLQKFILLGHLAQTARLAHRATLPSVPLSVQLLHASNFQNKESWTHLWFPLIWERNLRVGTQDCKLPQDGFHGLLLFQGQLLCNWGLIQSPLKAHSCLTSLSFGSGYSLRASSNIVHRRYCLSHCQDNLAVCWSSA